MPKHSIFAVKDIKLSMFNRPFIESSAIDAQRGFMIAVKDPQNKIGNFPQDFELHEIGQFDDVTGKIESFDTSKFITSGPLCIALMEEIERNAQNDAKRRASARSKNG